MKKYVEEPIKKVYVQIGAIADAIGESKSAVRYWCVEFGVTPKRQGRHDGKRLFNRQDVTDMIVIAYFIKYMQFTVKGAKIQFQRYKEGKMENQLPGEIFFKVEEVMK